MLRHVAMMAISAIIALAASAATAQPAGAYPGVTFNVVGDRPLLERPSQVLEAQRGAVEFSIGGESFAVDGLPSGYVEYSAKCVRMP